MSPTSAFNEPYLLDSCFQSSSIPLAPPIPNSYWATPLLCASEYPFSPGPKNPQLDQLLKAGIRTFIDLTEPQELIPYEGHLRTRARAVGIPDTEHLLYYRFPIPDRSIPSDAQTIRGIMGVLQKCEMEGRKAVVHCRGGIGRTGTIVGCWYIQSGRVKDGDGALQAVKMLWKRVEKCKRFPDSPETGQQCEFVRRFAKVVLDSTILDSRQQESANNIYYLTCFDS